MTMDEQWLSFYLDCARQSNVMFWQCGPDLRGFRFWGAELNLPMRDGDLMPIREWLDADYVRMFLRSVVRIRTGRSQSESCVFSSTLRHYDGPHHFIGYIHLIRSGDPESGYTGSMQDVTDVVHERLANERDLEMWKNVVDALPLRIFAKDMDNDLRYVCCNKAFAGHVNLKPSDVVGKVTRDIYPHTASAAYEFAVNGLPVTDAPRTVDICEVDSGGAPFDIRVTETPRRMPDGRRILFGFCSDQTESNTVLHLEKVIGEIASLPVDEPRPFLERVLRILHGNNRMDVVQLVWVSRTSEEEYVLFVKDVLSAPFGHPDEETRRLWRKRFLADIERDGLAAYEDVQSEIPECSDRLAMSPHCKSLAVLPILSLTGENVGEIVMIFRMRQRFTPRYRSLLRLLSNTLTLCRSRIMERKELHEQLERAESAERAKTYFFASVSHDIRTPLNSIIGFSELLKSSNIEEAQRRQYTEAIASSGQVLLNLVNDVLDLAKLEAGKMKFYASVSDVPRIVHELSLAFLPQAQAKGLKIRSDIEPRLPYVEIDRQRVRQILFNLIGNAVKFTDHGEIVVAAEFEPDSDGRPVGTFRFGVVDSGRGISEADLGRLMQPFVQLTRTDQGHGTGLGLAICRQLAQKMGGDLTIQSKVGVGSAFAVTLPNIPYTRNVPESWNLSQTQRIRLVSDPRSNARLRFLIVDDMDLNLMVLKNMLVRLGVKNIVMAKSGVEALAELEKDSEPFDAVLTDMWMPEMGGGELVGRIRRDSRFFTLPVYAVTADVEIVKTYKDLGFTGLLLKPVTLQLLTDFLENFSKTSW